MAIKDGETSRFQKLKTKLWLKYNNMALHCFPRYVGCGSSKVVVQA